MINRIVMFALALLFGAVLASGANAQQRWQNFGADPAYATREAAIADAENVFRRAGWPPEAVAAMTERMKTPGERIRIVNGDRFDFMRTGSSGLWRNVLVDFRRPVQNMEYAAPAERWTVTVGGVVYEAVLPDVCNNLAGRVTRVPPPPRLACAEIRLHVERGDRFVNFAFFDSWAPSECGPVLRFVPEGAVDNGGANPSDWRPMPTRCPMGPCDFSQVTRAVGRPLAQSGGWEVEGPGTYIVRVSRPFSQNNLAVFCIRHPNSESCGIDVRPVTDYHDWVATIFHDLEDIPETWTWRRLWWKVGECDRA